MLLEPLSWCSLYLSMFLCWEVSEDDERYRVRLRILDRNGTPLTAREACLRLPDILPYETFGRR